jgi:hypothetical protein
MAGRPSHERGLRRFIGEVSIGAALAADVG